MATLVTFAFRQWSDDGGTEPATGHIDFQPQAPIPGDPETTTRPARLDLAAGSASRSFEPGAEVVLTVHVASFPPGPYRVTVPDVPSISFSDLIADAPA